MFTPEVSLGDVTHWLRAWDNNESPMLRSNTTLWRAAMETDLPGGSLLHTASHTAPESCSEASSLLFVRNLTIACSVNQLGGVEVSS